MLHTERRCPRVVVLDVNETLSDMGALDASFARIGAPAHFRATWFAGVLRDGFALNMAGEPADFAALARCGLRSLLGALGGLVVEPDDGVEIILSAMADLPLHPDVKPGLERIAAAGARIVTLSNGAASVATALLERAGASEFVEQRLSVDAVGRWKPAPEPYRYAAERCEVDPAEMMLVAVHPWDITGAARAGLCTAWINRSQLPYPGGFQSPDVECESFIALADVLAARR
ncbi:MAG TPA: haloacid dehalogenase type II [Solirubrobacteraceae bacterium]|nr:haloacid dehalogenase type II [Solirubrobacteraceae bacterium]